jgi:hypothetical protein
LINASFRLIFEEYKRVPLKIRLLGIKISNLVFPGEQFQQSIMDFLEKDPPRDIKPPQIQPKLELTPYGTESIENLFQIHPSNDKKCFQQNPIKFKNKRQLIEDLFYSVEDPSKVEKSREANPSNQTFKTSVFSTLTETTNCSTKNSSSRFQENARKIIPNKSISITPFKKGQYSSQITKIFQRQGTSKSSSIDSGSFSDHKIQQLQKSRKNSNCAIFIFSGKLFL